MRLTQLIQQRSVFHSALVMSFWFFCCAAAPVTKTVLFLGDSITAGYGVDPSQAYPAIIQNKIDAKGWRFKVINAGQSGDTSAGGLSRLDWLLKNRIDILVLELGGNDGLRGLPVENTKKNLQAIIDRTRKRYPQVKIIIAGMKLPPNWGGDYSRRFEAMFSELAKKNSTALIPFVLEGVGGMRHLNLSDAIHPTPEGHKMVAANVWKVLEPVIKSLGAIDGLRGLPVENTKRNLQAIIDRTRQRYPQVKIIIAGMKLPPNLGRDYGRRFELMFSELAKKNKTALIPFVLEGVGGMRHLNLSDAIHPTPEGHKLVAANVWKVLEPVIKSLAARS